MPAAIGCGVIILLDRKFLPEQSRTVHAGKIKFFYLVTFATIGCTFAGELPDLIKITPGWQIVDDRGVFFKSENSQFAWGIIFPSNENLGSCEFSETKSTLKSERFNLQLVKNKLTIANATKSVTIEIKPNTVNLLNEDLTIQTSTNMSGIQLVPRKQWSRDASGFVTVYDLQFSKDFYNHFGNKN